LDLLLFELYNVPEIEPVTLSDLRRRITKTEEVEPLASTWALMRKDLEQNTPFARWYDETNEIHQMQWELTRLAIASIKSLPPTDPDFKVVRALLDRALHSDQYWWASASPWWSIEMIEAGAKDLKDVVVTDPAATAAEKQRAQELYRGVVFTAFEWQRTEKI